MNKKASVWCLSIALGVTGLLLMREAGKFDICTSQYEGKTGTFSAQQWEHRLAGSSIRVWYGEIYNPCSSGFISRKKIEHYARTLDFTRKLEKENKK